MTRRRSFIKHLALAVALLSMASGATAKCCLWKVSAGTGILYLQGSIHVLKADHYPLAPAIEKAYSYSDELVLEADMKEMAEPETQQRILAAAMLPASQTLGQILNAETYGKLSVACADTQMPITALEPFKPWYATMMLTFVQLRKMGFDPQHGLDQYFYDKAVADGKPVIGLESVDFQIDLFDRLADTNPNDLIAHALVDLEMMDGDMADLSQAWVNGHIDTLGALIIKGFDGYPSLYKTFVLDRNKRWANQLEELLHQPQTHMVVVGAAHLPGQGGLIELLKLKGFSVEQL